MIRRTLRLSSKVKPSTSAGEGWEKKKPSTEGGWLSDNQHNHSGRSSSSSPDTDIDPLIQNQLHIFHHTAMHPFKLFFISLSKTAGGDHGSNMELAYGVRYANLQSGHYRRCLLILIALFVLSLPYDYYVTTLNAEDGLFPAYLFEGMALVRLCIMIPTLVWNYVAMGTSVLTSTTLAQINLRCGFTNVLLGLFFMSYNVVVMDYGASWICIFLMYVYYCTPLRFYYNMLFGGGLALAYLCLVVTVSLVEDWQDDRLERFKEVAYVIIFYLFVTVPSQRQEHAIRVNFVGEFTYVLQHVQLRRQQERSQSLLHSMLSPAIVDMLKSGHHHIADEFKSVSVLFVEICDFDAMSSKLAPADLLKVLNIIFTNFDALVERHVGAFKVETIGEVYMVAGGCPHRLVNHREILANLALEMVARMASIRLELERHFSSVVKPSSSSTSHRQALDDEDVDMGSVMIRLGLHCGNVIAGVVGIRNPRFKLFGDVVNVASRLQTNSLEGKIQISKEMFQVLDANYCTEFRGLMELKGKGQVPTYFLDGHKGGLGSSGTLITAPMYVDSDDDDDNDNNESEGKEDTDKGSFEMKPKPAPDSHYWLKLRKMVLQGASLASEENNLMTTTSPRSTTHPSQSLPRSTANNNNAHATASTIFRRASFLAKKFKNSTKPTSPAPGASASSLKASRPSVTYFDGEKEVDHKAALMQFIVGMNNKSSNKRASVSDVASRLMLRDYQARAETRALAANQEDQSPKKKKISPGIAVSTVLHSSSVVDDTPEQDLAPSRSSSEEDDSHALTSGGGDDDDDDDDAQKKKKKKTKESIVSPADQASGGSESSKSIGKSKQHYPTLEQIKKTQPVSKRHINFTAGSAHFCKNPILIAAMSESSLDLDTDALLRHPEFLNYWNVFWSKTDVQFETMFSETYSRDWLAFTRSTLWLMVVVKTFIAIIYCILMAQSREWGKLRLVFLLHFGILLPSSLIYWVFSYSRHFQVLVRQELVTTVFLLTLIVVFNLEGLVLDWGHFYCSALALYQCHFSILRFPIRIALGCIILISYVSLKLWYVAQVMTTDDNDDDARPLVLRNGLYILIYFGAQAWVVFYSEVDQRINFHHSITVEHQAGKLTSEQSRVDQILRNLLPPSIVDQMDEMRHRREGMERLSKSSMVVGLDQQQTFAESFDSVTVLFTDMVNFTAFSSKIPVARFVNMSDYLKPHNPKTLNHRLVSFLNDMFTRFDTITEQHEVYKVEIIGDAYIIVGGCPVISTNHPVQVLLAGLDMLAEMPALTHHSQEASSSSVSSSSQDSPSSFSAVEESLAKPAGTKINIRIGVHTGPVVAGIVSMKNPRYHLFGETMSIGHFCESHGSPGRIHVSESTFKHVQETNPGMFQFDYNQTYTLNSQRFRTYFLDSKYT